MSDIQRYDGPVGYMDRLADGEYVLFADQEADCKKRIAEAVQAERATREECFRDFLTMRGVEMPCKGCGGLGVRVYGDTSTWMGGIGGQTMTLGVCDKCWGSGDTDKPWTNLRKLQAEKNGIHAAKKEIAAAVQAERERCRKEEVEPLKETVQEVLANALGEWKSLGNHPASRWARDAGGYRYVLAAVERIQKEKP